MTLAGQGTLAGHRLGHYQLEQLLGAGGMAEVYRARNLGRDGPREVAVKVLPASLASDPGYVERFREEARRVKGLGHPNIVPVLDYNEQRGLLYLVMPLLKESLRDRLEHERMLPPGEAVEIAGQIAAALVVAHSAGLIHRDVKPENILLDGKGRALLTDFGIARELAPRRGGTLYTVSGSGLPVGTPEYMPPEQLRAEHIDERADIYALGAVLYEMLTGSVPFPADTPYEVAAMVFTAPVVRPSQKNLAVSERLEQVVMRALEKDPAKRFHDASTFKAELEAAAPSAGLLTRAGRRTLIAQHFSWRPGSGGRAGGKAVPRAAGGPITGAPTMPPAYVTNMPTQAPTWAPPGQPMAPAQAGAGRGRWMLVGGILLLLAVTVCGGGGLAAANKLGLILVRPPQPTATLIPTATPSPTETPEPTATATLVPVPNLTVGSFTNWQSSTFRNCHWIGQQEVANPGDGQSLGWHWQAIAPNNGSPSLNTFKWGFSSDTPNAGMPVSPSQKAGSSARLYVSFSTGKSCSTTVSYTVTMFDSLNRSYTFKMLPS